MSPPIDVVALKSESAAKSKANEEFLSDDTLRIEKFLKKNKGQAFTAEEIYQRLYPSAQYDRSRMVELEYDIIPLLSKGTVEYKPYSRHGGKNEVEMYYYYHDEGAEMLGQMSEL